MYNFNCLCKLCIWFTTKIYKVKLIFYQPSKEVIVNIVPWAQSPQQFFLWYYPWLIWPRWVCAADLGWWSFHPLEFWTGCLFGLWINGWWRAVESYIFGNNHFFPQVFSMILSFKANLILYNCERFEPRSHFKKVEFDRPGERSPE